MSLPYFTMWAVALGIGVPAAWRNPTAGALVLCWVFSEGLYTLTGNGLAVDYFIFPDLFVLGIIFAKPERYPCPRYKGMWHQLACLFLERSWSDRLVMLSYPFVWACYASSADPYHKYWLLWWLAIAQYLIVGFEPLTDIFRRRGFAFHRPVSPTDLKLAYPGG